MDNTQPIPEPMLTNVKDAFGGGKNTYADTVLLEQGAQYGYNLAQVFVEELKKLVEENNKTFGETIADLNLKNEQLRATAQDISDTNNARIRELENENEKLRGQIKP